MNPKTDALDAVAVPLVQLDATFNVVACNKLAREAFGEFQNGAPVWAHFSKKSKFRKLLENAMETGDRRTMKVSSKTEIPAEFLVTAMAVSPEHHFDETVLILTFEDRTSTQDAKSMRSDFVANVSHEIRSPLTAISGFVETLQGAARNDPEARDLFLGLMQNEVERMTHLVRDLLSLSQVEAKERGVPRKLVDLARIVTGAQDAALANAQKKARTLRVDCERSLPKIYGSHDDLVRVFINLVENAVNYSNEGSEIFMSARRSGNPNPLGTDAVVISVKDQSEGILPEEIPRLTQRFYRIDKSRSRDAGGTGLGLAIVKHVLKRHRGKLVIDSVLGEGSEFQIYLPVPKTPERR